MAHLSGKKKIGVDVKKRASGASKIKSAPAEKRDLDHQKHVALGVRSWQKRAKAKRCSQAAEPRGS